MGTFTPSTYQEAVFTWIENGTGHAVIKAVPGSGKTTTLLQASKLPTIQRASKAVFLAFNVSIKDELKAKLSEMGSRMTAMTINGFGFEALRKAFGDEKYKTPYGQSTPGKGVQANKYYAICKEYLMSKMLNGESAYDYDRLKKFQKLVSLTRMTLTPMNEVSLWGLAEHYDLGFDRYFEKQEWDIVWQGVSEVVAAGILQAFVGANPKEPATSQEAKAIQPVITAFLKGQDAAQEVLQAAIDATANKKGLIDFDDQVFLPILWNLSPDKKDWIFVDEGQDLNAARLELIMRAVAGRLLVVGDENQSIYGFSGSDTDSMNKIIERTKATVLPLSICYRCPSSHIQLCADIVPGLEAAPDAPVGIIEYIQPYQLEDFVKEGDLILSRIKAPLISTCLSLIRSGKRAKVRGTDIGAKFIQDIKKLNKKHVNKITVSNFKDYLEVYRFEQAKLIGIGPDSELEIAELDDKVDTLNALHDAYCSEYPDEAQWNMDSFYSFIEHFFSDERGGLIILSTVHKAKGLEENRVFILQPEKMPHPKAKLGWQYTQEMNIKYVAFSRAKFDAKKGLQGELYFVTEHAPVVEEALPVLSGIVTEDDYEEGIEESEEVSLLSGYAALVVANLQAEKELAAIEEENIVDSTLVAIPEVLALPQPLTMPIADSGTIIEAPVLRETTIDIPEAVEASERPVNPKSMAGKQGGQGKKKDLVSRHIKVSPENDANLRALIAQGVDTSKLIDDLLSGYFANNTSPEPPEHTTEVEEVQDIPILASKPATITMPPMQRKLDIEEPQVSRFNYEEGYTETIDFSTFLQEALEKSGTQETSETIVRRFYSCMRPRCKHHWVIDYYVPARGNLYRYDAKTGRRIMAHEDAEECPKCGNSARYLKIDTMKAKYSEAHKCDSRCWNAKGPDCVCSCNGYNHSRGNMIGQPLLISEDKEGNGEPTTLLEV